MSTEFDFLNDDDDVVYVERRPTCVVLNSTGTRLGVGGASGFRVYALRQVSAADPMSSNDAIGRVQFHEVTRFPPPPPQENSNAALDDDDDFGFTVAESPQKPRQQGSSGVLSPSSSNCGVGGMALLGETQTVAVVGGGSSPIAPLHTIVIFFGVHRTHEIALQDAIRRLVMTRWFIVALTQTSLEVVSLRGDRLFSAPALGNPVHLSPGSLSLHTAKRLFAFPVAEQAPTTTAPNLTSTFSSSTHSTAQPTSLYGLKVILYPPEDFLNAFTPTAQHFELVTHIAEAHKNPLASISLNFDASLVATSSEHGTLIRVWTTSDGSLLKELRSASIPSPLSQLCFIGNLYIAGQSGGRMKVFFVGDEETKVNSKTQEVEWWKDHKDLAALAKNQGSKLATLGYLCTYFNSKWAAAEVELPIAKFTPVSMSIQSPGTTGGAPSSKSSSDAFVAAASAGTAAINGAVASTASSWMGYLGSWIGTASASAPPPPPPPPKVAPPPSLTPELSLTSTTRSDLAEYAPTNLEELCVVWWEHPISKFIINEANGGDQTGRARAYSQGGTAREGTGSAVHDKLCYFYCANCDGKLIRLEFDAQQGKIRVIGPTSPQGLVMS